MPGDFLLEFNHEAGLRVVIEDDGEVAYGYLFDDGEPSSLVWLYNRAAAPSRSPEWDSQVKRMDGERILLNVAEFIVSEPFELPKEESFEVLCDPQARSAAIYIHGRLHGILAAKAYPGKCVLAAVDGPLARRFDNS